MCGIAGFFTPPAFKGSDVDAVRCVEDMISPMLHRGPDDSGSWADAEAGIGLGHRRLSILDLSPLGRQPMQSRCGRYVITYNGEVYNHLELRKRLPDYDFLSTSDTETILAAIAAWGVSRAVREFVGMFAFALWDRQDRTLSLVRDRLGIKPLYYGRSGESLVFGSELKALRAHPAFSSEINRDALSLFFRHNYIPSPYSIYEGVRKVEPGTIVVFADDIDNPRESCYWSALETWRNGIASPFTGSEASAEEQLESLLSEAVSCRMLADVPLGAFLSGGIDSSLVASLMQANSDAPIRTFSIGFREEAFNEAAHAKAVADHLGTAHTELYVTARDMLDVVSDIPKYWDEPFADSSQIPTLLLSRLTREHVTVSLSGDGGDELFTGYERYFWMKQWADTVRLPSSVRSLVRMLSQVIPESLFRQFGLFGAKAKNRLEFLGARDAAEIYNYIVSHFKQPAGFVRGATEPLTAIVNRDNRIDGDLFMQMGLWDVLSYLPDDILTKVDRASMAASLEARVPLLDHRVVEFAASLPSAMKVRDGQSKWLLRKILYKHVPQKLIDRPKMGFGIPIGRWMRGELRDWCESMLDEALLEKQGLLDASRVRGMWEQHVKGNGAWKYYLWDVLMFQAWLSGDER